MTRIVGALVFCLAAFCAAPAAAQGWRFPDPKAEPWKDARLKLGPFFMNPTFEVKNIGKDDNVFNEDEFPREDLTGTLSMTSLIGLKIKATSLIFKQQNSYVWFRRYRSERSVDGSLSAVLEVRGNRLRPWVAFDQTETHERGSLEIDARAGRQIPGYESGIDIKFGWRLGASVGYRAEKTRYAEGEFFDGVDLAKALNKKAQMLRAYARYELTALTDMIAGAELTRNRYDRAIERDADAQYIFAGLESKTGAPVVLNVMAGVRRQLHEDPRSPDFEGVVYHASASFLPVDFMRLDLKADRDIGDSYDETFPFYVTEGGGFHATVRFVEHFDMSFSGRVEWLTYGQTLGGGEDPRTDRNFVGGAGFGYYLGGAAGTRLGVRWEYASRDSVIPIKNYGRNRFYSDFRLSF